MNGPAATTSIEPVPRVQERDMVKEQNLQAHHAATLPLSVDSFFGS
jgi:hypothetical protein